MLIQVAINNIESVEQGEEILKKWHYHLDEDQSHVVVERDIDGVISSHLGVPSVGRRDGRGRRRVLLRW